MHVGIKCEKPLWTVCKPNWAKFATKLSLSSGDEILDPNFCTSEEAKAFELHNFGIDESYAGSSFYGKVTATFFVVVNHCDSQAWLINDAKREQPLRNIHSPKIVKTAIKQLDRFEMKLKIFHCNPYCCALLCKLRRLGH